MPARRRPSPDFFFKVVAPKCPFQDSSSRTLLIGSSSGFPLFRFLLKDPSCTISLARFLRISSPGSILQHCSLLQHASSRSFSRFPLLGILLQEFPRQELSLLLLPPLDYPYRNLRRVFPLELFLPDPPPGFPKKPHILKNSYPPPPLNRNVSPSCNSRRHQGRKNQEPQGILWNPAEISRSPNESQMNLTNSFDSLQFF